MVTSNHRGEPLVSETRRGMLTKYTVVLCVVDTWLLVTSYLKGYRPGKTQVTTRETRRYRKCGRPGHDVWVTKWIPIWRRPGVTLQSPRAVTSWYAWKFLGSNTFCTWLESCWRGTQLVRRMLSGMAARDPFQLDRDQTDRSTEYGYGAGKFPDPHIDYSGGGSISRIPIADPTRHEQELELAMLRRVDVNNPADQPSPYVCGNTDRYGAQPPLVRERKPPKRPKRPQQKPLRMQRQW